MEFRKSCTYVRVRVRIRPVWLRIRIRMYICTVWVINPRRACAARVTVVVLCVCLFVHDYSRTTGYEAAYERYQHLQCHKGTKIKLAILLKRLIWRENKLNEHWLTSTAFSPFGAPWTNEVTKGIYMYPSPVLF